jgi:hypothetical protein
MNTCGDHSTEGHYTSSDSTQPLTDQKADNKNKGIAEDENSKDILANPDDPEKKLKIGPNLDPK